MAVFDMPNFDDVDGEIRHGHLTNEVVFNRKFDQPLEKLWEQVATPTNWIKWVGGRLDKFEVEVGGKFEICIAPQWNVMIFGEVLEYEPMRLLHITWNVPAWGVAPNIFGSTVKMETWADGENGSRIQFKHILPYDIGREHLLSAAWHLHMDQLGELVKGNTEVYKIETPILWGLLQKYLAKDTQAKFENYKHLLHIEG